MSTTSIGGAVVKRGEQRLADLYWRHADGAVRLAFLLTGDRHAAEDIAQDAFVRLFGRFQDLRSPDAFEVYLHRTVVNLSRDRFRRLKLERDRATEVNTFRPSEDTSKIEDRELIRKTLRGLPQRQQEALVLRYYLDLSEQQTAEVLQCSVAAVKSLVARATASLRKRMKGDVR
jgi:RNA polymerase sigma-70 factor (sigma-E family)